MPEIEKFDNAYYLPATGGYENPRTPNTFKIAGGITTGTQIIWTPASGKKFRLMGMSIAYGTSIAAAAAADIIFTWDDLGTPFYRMRLSVPVAPGTTTIAGGGILNYTYPGNGYLSIAANNTLRCGLSSALSVGSVDIMAFGTEE